MSTHQLIQDSSSGPAEHVNFFNDLEAGKYVSTKVNAEHVKEKKDEQEKYEKQVCSAIRIINFDHVLFQLPFLLFLLQIGYLTYLGQDTNESTGKRDWYDVAPNRTETFDETGKKVEVNLKSKLLHDPLKVIEKYVGRSLKSVPSSSRTDVKPIGKYESIIESTFKDHKRKSLSSKKSSKRLKKSKKKKHKKEKKKSPTPSSESSDDEQERVLQKQKLEKLRAERLQREKIERAKAESLLAKLRGDPDPDEKRKETKEASQQPRPIKQKYNSQFNPDIARQNFD